MADIPTKTSDLTNDSGFLTQHQQLTPVYSQTPTFSEWTFSGSRIDPSKNYSLVLSSDLYDESILWTFDLREDGIGINTYEVYLPEGVLPDVTLITPSMWMEKFDMDVTATRTRTDIIGYTLGSQSTKPLQPQGDYAPSTNIPKTALASDVQTSLGKADTAVQPAALRYDLVQTITLGQLQDRAVQKVELNAASTTLVLPVLTDLTGKVSDFGIDVINAYAPEADGTPTPTAASFQLDGTLGTDYNLIVPKGETWSDMTALAAGEMAVYYFTLSAFAIDDLPTWEVTKKVVEFVPVPTEP